MYILNGSKTEILNTDFIERICISVKNDAALIIASYNAERQPVTIARYKDIKEARAVLNELFGAMSNSQLLCFEMPESLLYAEQEIKRDARIRRKGGS